MKLLILGGTIFVGRHIAEAALARGADVTLFNRGIHNPELFPQAEKLRGDRENSLAELSGGKWDAVIDTCGYSPRYVAASAEFLATATSHYTFISSISVYQDFSLPNLDESAQVQKLNAEIAGNLNYEYGPLKFLCEKAVEKVLGERSLIVRPGEIVGPYDNNDRFTYWIKRVKRGGEVLSPGDSDRQIQFIDARDFAEWVLQMVTTRQTGVYNAAGPGYQLMMRDFLGECRAATNSDAQFIWVNERFLNQHRVRPYTEMPFWVPASFIGLYSINYRKAVSAGLKFRPVVETIRDTLNWLDNASGASADGGRALRHEKEIALLRVWHTENPTSKHQERT